VSLRGWHAPRYERHAPRSKRRLCGCGHGEITYVLPTSERSSATLAGVGTVPLAEQMHVVVCGARFAALKELLLDALGGGGQTSAQALVVDSRAPAGLASRRQPASSFVGIGIAGYGRRRRRVGGCSVVSGGSRGSRLVRLLVGLVGLFGLLRDGRGWQQSEQEQTRNDQGQQPWMAGRGSGACHGCALRAEGERAEGQPAATRMTRASDTREKLIQTENSTLCSVVCGVYGR